MYRFFPRDAKNTPALVPPQDSCDALPLCLLGVVVVCELPGTGGTLALVKHQSGTLALVKHQSMYRNPHAQHPQQALASESNVMAQMS